ncbi:hypothetical protein AVEN_9035-1 [Araneus ventricosus]|uniref:Integrase zinc-binding domain-containing protein n=1 Tax=Araneus ventricosus TaxID=182803 RepID=A0A4Y2TU17_ARAVE|nr:hypothetical protein AVEN_9035-1 [Araneus ventricosus]
MTSVLGTKCDFISHFKTNIVQIQRPENVEADVISRVSVITFPCKIDYVLIAEALKTDQELPTFIASQASLLLKKMTFPNSTIEVMCESSTGTARPVIPKENGYTLLSAMHNVYLPSIRRSVQLLKKRLVCHRISSDVAKWERHCSTC